MLNMRLLLLALHEHVVKYTSIMSPMRSLNILFISVWYIAPALFNPKGIYERSDASVRQKEGLQEVNQVLYGDVPKEIISEVIERLKK